MQVATTNHITDISTLPFIHKLHNFMHIISMYSNGAAITLSTSGQILGCVSGHMWFTNLNQVQGRINHSEGGGAYQRKAGALFSYV